jgi:hypothetical protein
MVCGRRVARQASVCRVAGSADARVFGSVMRVMEDIVVRGFRGVMSCDDTTGNSGV